MKARITDAIGIKTFPYRTRMLKAGDVFELQPGDLALLKIPFIEALPAQRPTMAPALAAGAATGAEVPQPRSSLPGAMPTRSYGLAGGVESQARSSSLEGKTQPELLEIAKERGVDLPTGYVKKDQLVEILQQDDGNAESV